MKKVLTFVLMMIVIRAQDVTRVSEIKSSTFLGKECDDTEYRNSNGSPNWKNYGAWLSECDSMQTVHYDAVNHLYYRRSMRGIAMIDLQKAYGKLMNTKDRLEKSNPKHPKLDKINNLISQLKIKISKS